MDREERKKQIQKSIKLIGWLATDERIKTLEDHQIFNELLDAFSHRQKSGDDEKLKEAGISF